MPELLVVLGVGELGSLYATGALKLGVSVTPGTRTHAVAWDAVAPGAPVLVAVGEDALNHVLQSIPPGRRDNVMLLQNELFPSQWQAADVQRPTVMVPWFSKKKGRALELSRPTLIHGPFSAFAQALHGALGIPAAAAADEDERNLGLVAKYTFILTINTLGVARDLTLGAWLQQDPLTVDAVLADACQLGEALLGARVDGKAVRHQVLEAFVLMAQYPARGRTAAARVQRAKAQAKLHKVSLTAVERLA